LRLHKIVLMLGRDQVLLETHSQVLRAAGHTVVSSSCPEQPLSQLRMGDFDLFLLRHSIPQDDRELLSHLMREHAARTSVVSVAANPGHLDTFSDATVSNDPGELIKGLDELISRDGTRTCGGVGHE
jgi:DNA-binding NtrC family response regulator